MQSSLRHEILDEDVEFIRGLPHMGYPKNITNPAVLIEMRMKGARIWRVLLLLARYSCRDGAKMTWYHYEILGKTPVKVHCWICRHPMPNIPGHSTFSEGVKNAIAEHGFEHFKAASEGRFHDNFVPLPRRRSSHVR